ncbi:hypothetical protein WL93_26625 [Burkholderia diffusa]|uniref:LPD7 domain-containing protein n=1 Tax=Burkholderia diffusa TaxID=488732 RepID=UPI00075E1C58|nr:LPD7 domain-containing protein [Burkholderia diffusa]KWF77590.1 hypothetical protein WL93_26625 [Burkholderia diffusa]
MDTKKILNNNALPLAEKLDQLGQVLTKADAGEVLTLEEREAVVNLAQTGMATKHLEIGGNDPTTRDANRVLEPQQLAAMGVARALAVRDTEAAGNPFEDEQLRRAYNSERTFAASQAAKSLDPFAEQVELTAAERALEDFAKAAPANDGDAKNAANDAAQPVADSLDAEALARVARARAADREAVEKQLGLNTVEPNIERERVQLDGAEASKRDAWVKKAQSADTEQPKAVDTPFKGNQVESDEVFTAEQRDNRPVVPPEVERQYLRVGDKFYHPKNTDMVAFEDKGNKLETRSNSEQVAENLVRIAESRGWDEIKVSGSETFRREAWLEAAARGMHVKGYTPSDEDLAALAKRQGEIDANKIEQGKTPFRARENEAGDKPPQDAAKPAESAQAKAEQREREADAAKLIAGVVVAHGAAKYMNDAKNSNSYFVTVRDDKGAEKTSWGVDLERAMKDAGAKVGDKVTLENEGRKQVTITVPVRDEKGKVVGSEEKEAHRNAWHVGMADTFKKESAEAGTQKHPELAGAYAAVAAMDKKAEADGLTPEQRAVVSARVRQNVGNSIERGEFPEVKRRKEVEVQVQTEVKEERELGR